jgi:DNA polymerase III delta' subunit
MVSGGLPHALLLVGPLSVGKTTLALDMAAAQMCMAPDPSDRPCRACRGCRLVDDGNHPDVHRLAPEGAGSVVGIDAIRQLITDLALLPVEGGARIAIIEMAHRMTEDAQNALLKTLEEPSAGVTLILCAEEEDRLLPTIHSRVTRVRLGTLSPRAIETLLEERGEADAPTANRLAHLAGGRPGIAIGYARSPGAVGIRDELARSLLDLLGSPPAVRLVRIRELLARSNDLLGALAHSPEDEVRPVRRAIRERAAAASTGDDEGPAAADGVDAETSAGGAVRSTPTERRRSAAALLEIWRDLARDLALLQLGRPAAINEPDLLEELSASIPRLPPGSVGEFLQRLEAAGKLLDSNANPELLADVVALAWPRFGVAA